MDERMKEGKICDTCQKDQASEKIKVEDLNFTPTAEYYFCSIFCRNVFLNANKGHIKTKNYGNTTARLGVMG